MSRKCFNVHVLDMIVEVEGDLELFGRPLEFVWVQGVVTKLDTASGQFSLDDGTGCLMILPPSQYRPDIAVGDYVLVQGSVTRGEDSGSKMSMVAVESRLVSKVTDPNMETLWMLEVMEAINRSIG